jgi:hypothetical protein
MRGGGGSRVRKLAHAAVPRHRIYCRLEGLKRWVIVHEVAHLLAWRDPAGHGAHFCRILMQLWAAEFGIDPEVAFEAAARHGVEIEFALVR